MMPPSLMRREGGSSGFRRNIDDKARKRLAESTLTEEGGNQDGGLVGDEDGSRGERFALDLPGNRFRELEQSRIQERRLAIQQGIIQDPEQRISLENAIEFRGTCTDMCPVFEREEREYKRHLHVLEMIPSSFNRVDPKRAVTIYHRPAAGISQPLPSDVRTPTTLIRTLDYLFHTVLTLPSPKPHPFLPNDTSSLLEVHGFIRDRTRGIRQDFGYQRSWGMEENVQAHERIARFHILSMYELGKVQEKADPSWLKQEAEQLNKTLITLIELYDDQRLEGKTYPNEPEFRAYQLLSHLNDNEVARALLDLPTQTFTHPLLQLAFEFRSLAQRNFDTQKVGRGYNTEISLNFFTRYCKLVKQDKVPYLIACLAHSKFGEIRRAGLRAMMKAYPRAAPPILQTNGLVKGTRLDVLTRLMGCTNNNETVDLVKSLDIQTVNEGGEIDGENPIAAVIGSGAAFNDNADAPVANQYPEISQKREGVSYQQVIDGLGGSKQKPTNQQQAVRYQPVMVQPRPLPPVQLAPVTVRPTIPAPRPAPQPSTSATFTPPVFVPPPQAKVLPAPVPQSTTPRIAPPNSNPFTAPPPASPIPSLPTHSSTPAHKKQIVKKRPTPAQLAQVSARIGSKLVGEFVETETSMVIQQALADETSSDTAKRMQVIRIVSAHIAGEIEDAFVKRAFAEVYQDARGVHMEALCFRHWLRLSRQREEEKNRIKEQQWQQKESFRADAVKIGLGASTMSSSRRSASVRSGLLLDHDLQAMDEISSTLREIEKRKVILEPGTFWSIAGNHIVQIAADNEPPSNEPESTITLALDASSTSQGNWLRRKLGLESATLYTAHFAGIRSAQISIDGSIDHSLDETTCLVVFECPANVTPADHQRFQQLLQRLPKRRQYRISLLVITWRDISTERLLEEFGPTNAFWSVHTIDMSTNATDRAFSLALTQLMPTLSFNPKINISLECFTALLRPAWQDLCHSAGIHVKEVSDQYQMLCQTAWKLAGCLEEVQTVLAKALSELDIQLDALNELKFAEMPQVSGMSTNQSATLGSLSRLVDQQEGGIGEAIEVIATPIRHRLQQCFDQPSTIVVPLLQELANVVFTYWSSQTIWIYADTIGEAEIVALRAQQEFQQAVENCRRDIAQLGRPPPTSTLKTGIKRSISSVSIDKVEKSSKRIADEPSKVERLKQAIAEARKTLER